MATCNSPRSAEWACTHPYTFTCLIVGALALVNTQVHYSGCRIDEVDQGCCGRIVKERMQAMSKKDTLKSAAGKAKNLAAAGAALAGLCTTTPIDDTPEKYAKEVYRASAAESARQRGIDSFDKAEPKSSSK